MAVEPFRELLKIPEDGEHFIEKFGGDLARLTIRNLVEKFTGKDLLLRESIYRKLVLLRMELLGPNPSALEKLLVERVVGTWLHLHQLETNYACRTDPTIALGEYFQRIISAAQKRYLAAVKALADVRRLALPALQVNIAKKQVNVATSSATCLGDTKCSD